MKALCRIVIIVALGVFLQTPQAFADNQETSENLCGATVAIKEDAVKNHLFELNNSLCKRIALLLLSRNEVDIKEETQKLESALDQNTQAILSFFDENHAKYPELKQTISGFMEDFKTKLLAEIINNNNFEKLYSLKTGVDQSFNLVWEISGLEGRASLANFKAQEDRKGICQTLRAGNKVLQYPNCKTAFNAISTGVNTYSQAYELIYKTQNKKLLNGLLLNWQRYVDTARNQTWLDENFDFWLQRNHYSSDHLVGPPKVQYFLLHPSLVYEWVDGEPDGLKDKASPALELLGFNRWDDRIPWGLSVVAIASDRVNYKPVSLGLTAFINNKYSFGAAYRRADSDDNSIEDEWSIYLNIDLLNFTRQKKNQFDKYKDNLTTED